MNFWEVQYERKGWNPTKSMVILNRCCWLFNIRRMYVHRSPDMNTSLHMEGRKQFSWWRYCSAGSVEICCWTKEVDQVGWNSGTFDFYSAGILYHGPDTFILQVSYIMVQILLFNGYLISWSRYFYSTGILYHGPDTFIQQVSYIMVQILLFSRYLISWSRYSTVVTEYFF